MNDKERIAYVRSLIFTHMREKEQLSGFVISDEDYDEVRWLVSQAEKVNDLYEELHQYDEKLHEQFKQLQQAQQEIEQLNKALDRAEKQLTNNGRKIMELTDQLAQVQAKAERYEKALREIADGPMFTLNQIHIVNIAKQALEGESS